MSIRRWPASAAMRGSSVLPGRTTVSRPTSASWPMWWYRNTPTTSRSTVNNKPLIGSGSRSAGKPCATGRAGVASRSSRWSKPWPITSALSGSFNPTRPQCGCNWPMARWKPPAYGPMGCRGRKWCLTFERTKASKAPSSSSTAPARGICRPTGAARICRCSRP